MSTKIHYANEMFPWAGISPDYTLNGFLGHRHTTARKLWASVLAGSDEQLVDSALRLERVSYANAGTGVTKACAIAFYKMMIDFGYTEKLLTQTFYPCHEMWRSFYLGWLVAKKDKDDEA